MTLPGLNYVVLDANKLTDRKTVESLITEYRATQQRIALAYVHVFEQSKGSADWWDKAHLHLRMCRRAVIFPKAPHNLIREERRTQRMPAGLRRIEDRRNTVALREFLTDPRPTSDISVVRTAIVGIFRRIHADGWLKTLVDAVTVDTAEEQKQIRKGLQSGDRQPLRDAVVGYHRTGRLQRQLESLLNVNGMSWRQAERLTRFASMSALTLLTYMCFGLRRKLQTGKVYPFTGWVERVRRVVGIGRA